ncbi:MAG: formylglycine-generating enzyme family protein [Candidatus Contendobacter sp.]|nr:formylglycine-generating enzyme family protein [Candidatus Contendobacter sp.]
MTQRRPDTDPVIVSRAICGRADLVRALAYADKTLLETAARLGYEQRPPSPPSGLGGEQTGETKSDNGDRQGSKADVQLETGPPRAIPFWQLVKRKFEVGPARKPDDDTGSTALPTWTRRPPTLATARPLATWRELMPRLRRALAEPAETHVLDVPAIVHRLGRGQSLEQLPRQRRRWGLSLRLIEDRSDHLAPYWGDQEQVRECLVRLFPHYAVAHALWFEGLSTPVWADGERSVGPYRPPPPGSLVVVLGDLGCLARGGADLRRHWLAMGQRLAADGCRTLALTPAPEGCPEALRRYWTPLPWERLASVIDPEARRAQVQRLITLASSALRIEPGLLRELRLLIDADAGAESAFWQEPAVVGKSSVATTLSAAEAQQRREAFAQDDLKEQALELLRDWRAGLPSEIWFAEIETLRPEERDHLPEESDVRQAAEFFAALGRQAAGVRDAAPVPGAIPWFREIATRLPEGYLDDPELGRYFHDLWTQVLRRDPRALPPPGLHPENVLTEAPARRVDLYQQGGDLLFSSPALAAEMVSPLASLETANGLIRIEEEDTFWRSGQPPSWADDWGTDDYGHWVTFSIRNQQGQKITQRMRWIEPGSFLMGSSEDEPERSNPEGSQHSVTINQGFWLFDTACTQVLWEAVMGDNPSEFKGVDRRPVENISWNNCQSFIKRLNERLPGLDLALPSEAQWEYACRAGTTTPFSFGDNITPDQVNCNGNYPYAGGKKGQYRQETVPVASLPLNPWGLYEMHGNVWEWCQDHWHDNYQGAPTDGSAWEGSDAGAGRVLRGGSWFDDTRGVRAAYRAHARPGVRGGSIGLRCAQVRVASPDSPEGAEPAGPARGRQAERRPEQGLPGGATGAQPTLLRLDAGESPAHCPLPQTPAFLIRTDREHLTFRRLTKPEWASAIGRDRFGLWCEIAVEPKRGGEPVIQRLRWIPLGRFWMGSPEEETRGLAKDDDERKWFERERPRHLVTLTEGYWLFDTPCTQALWEAVMEKNPSRFQSPTRPVERVSWHDAQDFLKQLNGRIPGLDLTLPSEAQWEYACRAGIETAIYTGELAILGQCNAPALHDIAWYSGNSGVDFDLADGENSSAWLEKQYPHTKAGTQPVKLKRANPWGLHDMLGNVWEWCQDGMRSYDAEAQTNPTGLLDAGAGRIVRGGSWYDVAHRVRSASRFALHPDFRNDNIGFRCARVRVVIPTAGRPEERRADAMKSSQ